VAKEKKKVAPKPKDLNELRAQCDKEYGAGTLIMGQDAIVDVEVWPSGIAQLDREIGVGGIPRGRILEIFGVESCGKTTLCHHLAAACQRHYFEDKDRSGVAAFIDVEHAVDPDWEQSCGVNWETLLFSQPNSGDEALKLVQRVADSGLVDLVILDSVAALTPQCEIDGEIGDVQIGALARLMSQSMRKIHAASAKNKCTIIFINQIREKIGVMFGNPETTPGGRALRHYTSARMDLTKGSKVKDDNKVIGFSPKCKFIKTKIGQPFREFEFKIYSGDPVSGIDTIESLVKVGLDSGILTKKGHFVNFGKETLGNGMANAYDKLRLDVALADDLRNQIYNGLYAEIEKKKAKARAAGTLISQSEHDAVIENISEALNDGD